MGKFYSKGQTLLITDFGLSRETDTGTTSVASGATTLAADNVYGTAGACSCFLLLLLQPDVDILCETTAWTAPEFFRDNKVSSYPRPCYLTRRREVIFLSSRGYSLALTQEGLG